MALTLDEKPGFYFQEIDESEVSPEKVREAKRVLDYCRRLLSLPEIKIIWCKKISRESYEAHPSLFGPVLKILRRVYQDDSPFSGQTKFLGGNENKIWLRSDISLEEVSLTVAHECMHIHDFGPKGRWRPPLTKVETEITEERAEKFEAKIKGILKQE